MLHQPFKTRLSLLKGPTNRGYQPLTSPGMIHQVGRSNDFHHWKFASIIHGRWNEPVVSAVKPFLLQAGWLVKPSMASAELAKVTELNLNVGWLVLHLAASSCYCWFRNPANQLSLVVEIPLVYKVLYASQVVGNGISEPSTVGLQRNL